MENNVLKNMLAELFLAAIEFNKKSKLYYTDVMYSSGVCSKFEITIRLKKSYEYVEERNCCINQIDKEKMKELIEFILNYEEKKKMLELKTKEEK